MFDLRTKACVYWAVVRAEKRRFQITVDLDFIKAFGEDEVRKLLREKVDRECRPDAEIEFEGFDDWLDGKVPS